MLKAAGSRHASFIVILRNIHVVVGALRQIGPRMQLEVVKVEEGLCAGRVLFHSLIARSAAETAAQQADVEERQRLKAERRRQQARPLGHKGWPR